MNLWIYETMNLWIYESMNLWIYESTNLPIYKSTNLQIYKSTNLPIYQSINLSIVQTKADRSLAHYSRLLKKYMAHHHKGKKLTDSVINRYDAQNEFYLD